MKSVTLAAVAASVLTACSTPYDPTAYVRTYGPEPTKEQIEQAKTSLIKCLYRVAPTVDDGISDAGTIGRAVAGQCTSHSDEYARVRTWPMTDMQRAEYYRGWYAQQVDLATTAVLKIRAEQRR